MSALEPRDVERFGKLLGMVGSDFDGERAAAAAKATAFLTDRDLRWNDVADAMAPVPAIRTGRRGETPPSPRRASCRPRVHQLRHQEQAGLLLASHCPWNEWEARFLTSLLGWRSPLSDKQAVTMGNVIAKFEAWAAATGRAV